MASLLRSPARTLAIGYIAFGVVALVLFAAPLWVAWRETIEAGRAEILKADAQRLTEVFRRGGADGLAAFIRERVGLQIAGERILLLTDRDLRPLAGNLVVWPSGAPTQAGVYTVALQLEGRLTRVTLVHVALGEGYHLLVGRDIQRFEPLEQHFWRGLALAVAILSVVGIVGGLALRRAIFMRVQGIQATASAIMQGNLSHRLPTRQTGDELDLLAQTINRMLEQIEHLINGVRNVSNSIAHDLRTPLAELRSRLEELALTRPPPEETFAELDDAVTDVDRVIGIFDALLRLAQIDTGMRRSGFVTVDAAALTGQAVELYQPAAEEKGFILYFEGPGPATVAGDPILLAQAVNNLIDNALKYGHPGESIVVEVRHVQAGRVEIAVADRGAGISDEEKLKVTERFYRGDTSRGTPGAGLGLSLVDAVAKLHGGSLRLKDHHPGLIAVLSIAQKTA